MPDNNNFFGRTYKLTVYKSTSPSSAENFKVERQNDFDTLTITGHKIEFEIERDLKRNANQASLKIINLAESSRTAFKDDDLYLVFEAGYGTNLNVIFSGDVVYAMSEKEGTEWVTHVEVGDGDRMLASARIARSYRPGTSVRTILQDAYGSVGQRLPENIQSDPAFDKVMPKGYTAFGELRKALTTLLKPLGYTWSIQDGRIQVLSAEGTTNILHMLSSASAMIGSPEFGQPPKTTKKGKKKQPTVTVKCLLYPQLRPGAIVEVQSRDLSGRYKLLKVKHSGDYMGKNWTTEVEINPLSEATQRTNQMGGNPARPAQR